MKMKNIIAVLGFCATALFMVSCGGDSGLSLTVNSPTDGQVYAPGDVVSITGVANDDLGVTSIQFIIESIGVNESLSGMANQTVEFTYDVPLDINRPPEDDVEIKIISSDEDGNSEEVKRKINIR